MGRTFLWIQSNGFFRNWLLVADNEAILEQLEKFKKQTTEIEESIMSLNIRTEGKVSLSEAFSMPFKLRDLYVKSTNKYIDDKNKLTNGVTTMG